MRFGGFTRAAPLIGVIALASAPAAFGQGLVTKVEADGNPAGIPEPLRFQPKDVKIPLGGVVQWTNTDLLVPHTATEDHGLWNMTGTYGGTASNPPGFGPGETRERPFTAGTWSYFCEVHPADMRGTVTVPLTVSDQREPMKRKGKKKKKKGKGKGKKAGASATPSKGMKGKKGKKKKKRKPPQFEVVATWALEALPPGQVFDVERSVNGGPFAAVGKPTSDLNGVIKGGPAGTRVSVRVRVIGENDPGRASGYSPVATITVG